MTNDREDSFDRFQREAGPPRARRTRAYTYGGQFCHIAKPFSMRQIALAAGRLRSRIPWPDYRITHKRKKGPLRGPSFLQLRTPQSDPGVNWSLASYRKL